MEVLVTEVMAKVFELEGMGEGGDGVICGSWEVEVKKVWGQEVEELELAIRAWSQERRREQ
jgi:hypothetical protein